MKRKVGFARAEKLVAGGLTGLMAAPSTAWSRYAVGGRGGGGEKTAATESDRKVFLPLPLGGIGSDRGDGAERVRRRRHTGARPLKPETGGSTG